MDRVFIFIMHYVAFVGQCLVEWRRARERSRVYPKQVIKLRDNFRNARNMRQFHYFAATFTGINSLPHDPCERQKKEM